jgi:hypothetical protein
MAIQEKQRQCCSNGREGAGILVVVGLDFDFDVPNRSIDNKAGQRREGFFTVL